MEYRYYKGPSTDSSSRPNRVRNIHNRPARIQKSASVRKFILKALPFAVLATSIVLGIGDTAFAATIQSPIDLATHLAQGHTPSLNPFQPMMDQYTTISHFFATLPDNIGKLSVTCMSGLYKLTANLILKTPTWIFDNQWFKDTTLLFSSAAIGITSSLTAIEGIRRMLSGFKPKGRKKSLFKFLESAPMDMKEIAKRWGIASIGMLSAPWLFQKAFKGLNWLSDKLIGMNADLMDASKFATHLDWFNVLTMGVFDVILISTLIPTLWKNGRRFFDLLVLGLVAPLAMTAWIFDSHRSKFDQWWSSVKELSFVQLYHALFLLVIGWFIYGIPTPADPIGMIIKLLIVIGGFARMIEPPRMVSNHLNPGNYVDFDDPKDMAEDVKKNFDKSLGLAKAPIDVIEKVTGKKFITVPLKWWARKKAPKMIPPIMRVKRVKKAKVTTKSTPRRKR